MLFRLVLFRRSRPIRAYGNGPKTQQSYEICFRKANFSQGICCAAGERCFFRDERDERGKRDERDKREVAISIVVRVIPLKTTSFRGSVSDRGNLPLFVRDCHVGLCPPRNDGASESSLLSLQSLMSLMSLSHSVTLITHPPPPVIV